MLPIFFGDSENQLYGVYQEPADNRFTNVGVVFCYPLAQEYMRSHFAFQKLSRLLSKRGVHTLKFDYFGTGDSVGTSDMMSMDSCLESLRLAINELKDMAGVTQIILVGLRFGGLLAGLITAREVGVDKIILWDPVIDGAAYLQELRALHQQLIEHPFYIPSGHKKESISPDKEILTGSVFQKNFLSSLGNLSLLEADSVSCKEVYLYLSCDSPAYQRLRDSLSKRKALTDYRVLDDFGDWSDIEQFDIALMPTKILAEIAERPFDRNSKGAF